MGFGIIALAVIAAFTVAGTKKTPSVKRNGKKTRGRRHGPLELPIDGSSIDGEGRKRRFKPIAGLLDGMPMWDKDQDRIQAKATEIWNERSDKTPTPGARFAVTRNALLTFWPSLPWPQVMNDQAPINVPGTTGVFEQKWVVDAGPRGNAMKIVWNHTVQFVNNMAFGGNMPD